jgi:hypothetical protein
MVQCLQAVPTTGKERDFGDQTPQQIVMNRSKGRRGRQTSRTREVYIQRPSALGNIGTRKSIALQDGYSGDRGEAAPAHPENDKGDQRGECTRAEEYAVVQELATE